MEAIQHGQPVPVDAPAWEETFITDPIPDQRYIAFGLKISYGAINQTLTITKTVATSAVFDYHE